MVQNFRSWGPWYQANSETEGNFKIRKVNGSEKEDKKFVFFFFDDVGSPTSDLAGDFPFL